MGLALVVRGDGVPFDGKVWPDGTADVTTIPWLLAQLQAQFQDSRATRDFDRGMVSQDNLARLEAAEIKDISAMAKSPVEGVSGIDVMRFARLEPPRGQQQVAQRPGFTPLSGTTCYRDVTVEGQRRDILCFTPDLFPEQHHARAEAVRAFRACADAVHTTLRAAKQARQRQPTLAKFKRPLPKAKRAAFVDVELHPLTVPGPPCPICTSQGPVVVAEDALRHAGRLDGLGLLVTNHGEKGSDDCAMPAHAVIRPYQEKGVIASSFRDSKSFIDIAPVYVWTGAHVKAHYTGSIR